MPSLKVVDSIHKPLKLYYNSDPTVQYAHNNRSTVAAKHIDIKYYIVKDKVWDQIISIKHISIEKCSWIRLLKAYHRMCLGNM